MKIKDVLDRYLAERGPHTSCPELNALYAGYFKTVFGDKDVAALSHADFWDPDKGYVARRTRGEIGWTDDAGVRRGFKTACNATIRREITMLKAAMVHCTRIKEGGRRLLSLDDIPHIQLPEHNPPKMRWLLREEAGALLAAAQPKRAKRLTRVYRFIAAGLFTAARKDSIITLDWPRIHLQEDNARDYLERLERGENPEARNLGVVDYRDPGKVHKRKRRAIVPIMPEFAEVLLRAKRERQNNWYLDTPTYPRKAFEKVVREAGMWHASPHMLRHTWATWAAQDSVPMFEIAGVLGDTVQTVERVYAHHDPQFMQRASNRRLFESRVGVG